MMPLMVVSAVRTLRRGDLEPGEEAVTDGHQQRESSEDGPRHGVGADVAYLMNEDEDGALRSNEEGQQGVERDALTKGC